MTNIKRRAISLTTALVLVLSLSMLLPPITVIASDENAYPAYSLDNLLTNTSGSGSYNPCNKQDDEEVLYNKSSWIQPSDWNLPILDPKDYNGAVMLYLDKISVDPQDITEGNNVRTIYFSMTGADVPVSTMKFHLFYDTRLKVKPNSDGTLVKPGTAVQGFNCGSAMIEEGQIAFYAYSDEKATPKEGNIFTIKFYIPVDPEPGSLFPIGFDYRVDDVAPDLFINNPRDYQGMMQMTYAFTNGMHNGWIRIHGEKKKKQRGDLNKDGQITTDDAIIAARFAAGYGDYRDRYDSRLADMNIDGSVTADDAIIIARYAANYGDYREKYTNYI